MVRLTISHYNTGDDARDADDVFVCASEAAARNKLAEWVNKMAEGLLDFESEVPADRVKEYFATVGEDWFDIRQEEVLGGEPKPEEIWVLGTEDRGDIEFTLHQSRGDAQTALAGYVMSVWSARNLDAMPEDPEERIRMFYDGNDRASYLLGPATWRF